MVDHGLSRCVLPDKIPPQIPESDIYYVPYLRFKGQVYYSHSLQLKHKIVDTTRLGVNFDGCPPSLGVRPQAMKLSTATGKNRGRFIVLKTKGESIFSRVNQLLAVGLNTNQKQTSHHKYIGETVSIIYLPIYISNGSVYDGVLNRIVEPDEKKGNRKIRVSGFKNKWLPRFLTTLCPHCGDNLHGEHDSVVLLCRNCKRAYRESAGQFIRVKWSVAQSKKKKFISLPFWKISIEVEGVLSSFVDLLRLTNQPVSAVKQTEKQGLFFLVPAFKLRPKTFLQAATSLTLAQHRIPKSTDSMQKDMHSVTLSVNEAEQALGVVLAALSLNKKIIALAMGELEISVKQSELLYIPFIRQGHDLVDQVTGMAIGAHVLRYGRSL